MSGLELSNVVKRFGTTTVVQQMDLSIAEGEFVVLLGESGCGKSTTLRMIQRRDVLRQTLRVFGAALPLASNAQSALSRFKGTTLRIHYPAHPHYERVERQFALFTELTGIRIEGHRSPYLDMKVCHLIE